MFKYTSILGHFLISLSIIFVILFRNNPEIPSITLALGVVLLILGKAGMKKYRKNKFLNSSE